MSWICPHCGTTATLQAVDISQGTGSALTDTARDKEGVALKWYLVRCPSKTCCKFVFDMNAYFGVAKKNLNGYRTGDVTPDINRPFGIGQVRFEPRVGAPLSAHVSAAVREDYDEAYLIKDLSPKAAATLCRRALQGMIRHFHGIQKHSLHDELLAIKNLCDHELFAAMMGLKGIGNIGAHPEKDINLIVDVEEGEVETLLGLIKILDDEWYVAKAARSSNLAAVKSLAAAKAAAQSATVAALPSPPSAP